MRCVFAFYGSGLRAVFRCGILRFFTGHLTEPAFGNVGRGDHTDGTKVDHDTGLTVDAHHAATHPFEIAFGHLDFFVLTDGEVFLADGTHHFAAGVGEADEVGHLGPANDHAAVGAVAFPDRMVVQVVQRNGGFAAPCTGKGAQGGCNQTGYFGRGGKDKEQVGQEALLDLDPAAVLLLAPPAGGHIGQNTLGQQAVAGLALAAVAHAEHVPAMVGGEFGTGGKDTI